MSRSLPDCVRRLRLAATAGVLCAAVAPGLAAAKDSDSFLIVDCLLPGRVQRLGEMASYVTARKAVQTSAADCRKRGGEYTESDGASYASLMRVWMPLAKAGDVEAQTNLGEIFEKGLGGPPQPDLAVQWYRLAADKGYARAQVDLGSLYERGLGVPRDMAKAMELYRQATGLVGAAPQAAAPTADAMGDRLDALNRHAAEVAALKRQIAGLQSSAATSGLQRTQLEAQLRQRESELADSRQKLAALSTQADRLDKRSEPRAAKGGDPGIRTLTTSPTATVRLDRSANFGRYHALVIGNNNYRYGPKLSTAVADARAVGDVLKRRYGFETTVLLDADRYQILSALNALRERLTAQDNLLIYYAGHGELDPVTDRGYWLPVDAEARSNANWIASYQITDLVKASAARQVMLVVDSCFSGVMTRSTITRVSARMSDDDRQRWYKSVEGKHARVVLTSGGEKPVLDIGGGAHSVFAASFLEALEGNTGILEGQKLAQSVIRQVAISPQAAKIDQVPVYAPLSFAGHEAGDFFFVPVR